VHLSSFTTVITILVRDLKSFNRSPDDLTNACLKSQVLLNTLVLSLHYYRMPPSVERAFDGLNVLFIGCFCLEMVSASNSGVILSHSFHRF
jgi:hypothetical protein